MHKIISIILLFSLFITVLCGCSIQKPVESSYTTSHAPTESTIPTVPTQTIVPTDPTQPASQYNNPMGLSDSLIYSLISHLWQLTSPGHPPYYTYETYLNAIKLSEDPDNNLMVQALCTTIDPDHYYYVCGYYDTQHERESIVHCCKSEYLWLKFDKAEEIPESYNGQPCIVAFQINESSDCKNIMPISGSNPAITYFQLFAPEFVDGFNATEPLFCDQTLVFWCRPPRGYFSDNLVITLPSVVLDGVCYLKIKMYTARADGEHIAHNTASILGKYYDALLPVLITDRHTETDESGDVIHYGLLKLSDVAIILANWEE